MIYLPVLVGFLLVGAANARVGKCSELGIWCETKEALVGDVVCKTDRYEVRHFDSVKWVSTVQPSYFMELASYQAFRRLFNYISGGNENGEKIDMTTPVVIKMPHGQAIWEKKGYTMSFMLPASHQENPPKPTDKDVFIHEMPAVDVYVTSYGGWMSSWSDRSKTRALSSALNAVDAKCQRGFHFAVGYNSPMTMFNRHNEVWLVADGEPVCSSSEEQD